MKQVGHRVRIHLAVVNSGTPASQDGVITRAYQVATPVGLEGRINVQLDDGRVFDHVSPLYAELRDEQPLRDAIECANRLVSRAGIVLDAPATRLLAQDIVAVRDEIDEDEGHPFVSLDAATEELERRIGGAKNLDEYVRCLVGGAKRSQA